MTYEFHYPTPSNDWHEEGTESKQSLEEFVTDAKQRIEEHDKEYEKYKNDFFCIEGNSMSQEINILSDLEVITKEEAKCYHKTADDLLFAINSKITKRDPACWQYSVGWGVLSLMPAGFLVGIPASAIMKSIEGTSIGERGAVCFGLWALSSALFAAGHYIYTKIDQKRYEKRLASIDLDRAYDDFLDAIEPLRNLDLNKRGFNPEKTKKYEDKEIIRALETVKNSTEKIYEHFNTGDENDV